MYDKDPSRYHDWERFSSVANNCIFFHGGMKYIKMAVDPSVPKILFFGEEQTWDRDSTDAAIPYVDKILTHCSPKITGRKKRVSVFYPINEENLVIKPDYNKPIDVIYAGFATGPHVMDIIDVITKFNYRWTSYGDDPRVTNRALSNVEKMHLLSHSKISVCHGLAGNQTPQTKTRFFEAAASKSLILCLKDRWNSIEEWFVPDVDFMYYESKEELSTKIVEIVHNFDKYIPMIEAAYKKTLAEYTTFKFIEKYVGFKQGADLTSFRVF